MPGTVLRTGGTSKSKTDNNGLGHHGFIWTAWQSSRCETVRTHAEAVHLGMKNDSLTWLAQDFDAMLTTNMRKCVQ